jgi:hypothetical protein
LSGAAGRAGGGGPAPRRSSVGQMSMSNSDLAHLDEYDEYEDDDELQQPTANFAAETLVSLLCHEDSARLVFVNMPGARRLLDVMIRPPSRPPTRRAGRVALTPRVSDWLHGTCFWLSSTLNRVLTAK